MAFHSSMNTNLDQLVEGAKNTLEGNWIGNFTIPAATLYPHQWVDEFNIWVFTGD